MDRLLKGIPFLTAFKERSIIGSLLIGVFYSIQGNQSLFS